MPLRRSHVFALDVIAYRRRRSQTRPPRQLRDLRAGDRDGARGHCRTLRRLEVGPFSSTRPIRSGSLAGRAFDRLPRTRGRAPKDALTGWGGCERGGRAARRGRRLREAARRSGAVRGRGGRRRGRPARQAARLSDGESRRRRRPGAAAARDLRRRGAGTTGRRSRSASTRTTAATGCASRRTCSTSTATSTGSGWWSSCGSGCATSARSQRGAELSTRSRPTSRPRAGRQTVSDGAAPARIPGARRRGRSR